MLFQIIIKVMPLKNLLDPQGKAVQSALHQLSLNTVTEVRVGKTIQLTVEAENEASAASIVTEASKRLLSNPVMESFEIVEIKSL